MSAVLKFDYALETMECANCFMVIALPKRFIADRRDDHRTFYCPVGHHNFFPAKSEAEKLREQLEHEKQRTFTAQQQTRMEREQREKLERKLKRVSGGACPECNRHFKNVERHMKSKHAPQPTGA